MVDLRPIFIEFNCSGPFLVITNDHVTVPMDSLKSPFKSIKALIWLRFFFLSEWVSISRWNVIWNSVSVCRFLPILLVHTAISICVSLQRNWDSFFCTYDFEILEERKIHISFFLHFSVFFIFSMRFALILSWMSLVFCVGSYFVCLFTFVMLCATLFWGTTWMASN